MNLLYSFPFRMGITGIGMTAWQQVQCLIREGVHVDLFCGSLERPIIGAEIIRQTLVPYGLRLPIRLFGIYGAAIFHDLAVARWLKTKKKKYDIVHCWSQGAIATIKTAKRMGIKTAIERQSAHTGYVYDIVSKECNRLGISLENDHFASKNNKVLSREENEFELADALLCPSDFVINTFVQNNFPQRKLFRHQYGYDPSVFPTADSLKKRNKNDKFQLLFVGEGYPLKGIHFALEAWLHSDIYRNGDFHIYGSFNKNYFDYLHKRYDHPSIHYSGFSGNISEIMAQSHALILPSLAEGSALVTYEARAAGCVLLVSESSGAVCSPGKDALVHKTGDIRELTEQLIRLASDLPFYDSLQEMSIRGIGQLTWQNAAKKTIEAYELCISSDHRSI
jgi:glycosyltransferase involved in cell wall biosynthesis